VRRRVGGSVSKQFVKFTVALIVGLLVDAAIVWSVSGSADSVNIDGRRIPNSLKESARKQSKIAATVAALGHTYDTIIVDTSKADVELYFRDGASNRIHSIESLRRLVSKQGRELVFATNGGMFTPSGDPVGLYIERGREISPLNLEDGNGNFFLKPNGVFSLTDRGAFVLPSEDFAILRRFLRIKFATQSGPLLVHEGRLNALFRPLSDSRYIRSGVGLITPTTVVFAISRDEVNFYEFGSLFKQHFHCDEALYFDGGISRMYLPAINRRDLDGDFGVIVAVTREAGK